MPISEDFSRHTFYSRSNHSRYFYMKSPSLAWIWILLALLPISQLFSQNSNSSKATDLAVESSKKKEFQPLDEATLKRLGKASTVAEAAPLLKELEDIKEAHFQARRAAKVRMKGKSEAEMTKIWAEMLAAEKKRLERLSELESTVSEFQRQEWAKQRAAEKGKALGRS